MMPAMQTVQTRGGQLGPKPYYRIGRTENEIKMFGKSNQKRMDDYDKNLG